MFNYSLEYHISEHVTVCEQIKMLIIHHLNVLRLWLLDVFT